MSVILSVLGFTPKIPENCFLTPNCTIVGDVEMGEFCSIWFQAVIRGDVAPIRLGARCNIQDGVIIHGTFQKSQTVLEEGVSVGHGAMLHGCRIGHHTLVGMKSTIMDHAEIGPECLIGAGTLITLGSRIPPRSLVMGTPGKVVRTVTDEELQWLHQTTENYILYSGWYKK